MIEPEVFGDPAAMRAMASELIGRADIIAAIPSGVATSLDAATFEGGAAKRLRSSAIDARAQVASVAAELRAAASALMGDATEVEHMNAEAKAAAEAAEKGAAANAAAATHHPAGSTASTVNTDAPTIDDIVAVDEAAP